MYKLTFKGRDAEPIFLEDEKGKVILDLYLNNKSSRLIANNQAFNTGDIKSIFLVEKSRSETFSQNTINQELEYDVFRKKMLSLSLESRSKILRIPKIVWQANTQDEMTNDIKEEIIKRQFKYFTEHPNCIYSNPACYRDLIPKPISVFLGKDKAKHINQIVGGSMMRFIEDAVRTDLQLSLK